MIGQHPSKSHPEVIRGKFGAREAQPGRGDVVNLARRKAGARADDTVELPETERDLGLVAVLGYN